jgi:hypothetical protein
VELLSTGWRKAPLDFKEKQKTLDVLQGSFLLDGFIQICHHPEVRNILGERVQLMLFRIWALADLLTGIKSLKI